MNTGAKSDVLPVAHLESSTGGGGVPVLVVILYWWRRRRTCISAHPLLVEKEEDLY